MTYTMNFDTRTVIDIISINDDLKTKLIEIISEEKIILKKMKHFSYEDFLQSLEPRIKYEIKLCLKKDLKAMQLSVLCGIINVNNIDCKCIIDSVSIK